MADKYVFPYPQSTFNTATGLSQYLGVVASNCRLADHFYPGYWQTMGRTAHMATENLSSIAVVYANWGGAGGNDTAVNVTATLEVSIEYPVGTYQRIKFGGADVGNAAGGANFISDMMPVNIPKGAIFGLRAFYTATGGSGIYGVDLPTPNTATNIPEGAFWTNGATLTNMVMSGGTVNSGSGPIFRPVAILGMTTRPSVLITGDSIAFGMNDGGDYAVKNGYLERSIPFGCINVSKPGEPVNGILTSGFQYRKLLAQYCSHVVTNYGINDIAGGRTPAQVAADLGTFKANYFPNLPYIVSTLLPYTTSTDSWATEVNQTVQSSEVNRLAFNDLIRTGAVVGAQGIFDTDQVFAASYSSGKIKAFGTSATALTADGEHPNHKGNIYIAAQLNATTLFL